MSKGDKSKTVDNKVYSLGKLDYCLRKAIGIQVIGKRIRTDDEKGSSKKPTEEEFAEEIGAAQSQVSKWMNKPSIKGGDVDSLDDNKRAPGFEQILRASVFFHMTLYEMIKEAIKRDENAGEAEKMLYDNVFGKYNVLSDAKKLAEDLDNNLQKDKAYKYEKRDGEDYLSRIRKLERARYVGFYLEYDGSIGHFILETASALKTAAVPGLMRVVGKEENPYRCNIISPMNQKQLYIYLRQDSAGNDRGMMIFYIGYHMQGSFQCGSGVLISSNRDNGASQSQWVVILRMEDRQDDAIGIHVKERELPGRLQYLGSMADEMNRLDEAFVSDEAMKAADQMIRPVLEEPLPAEKNHVVSYECVHGRQKVLYDTLYKPDLQNLKLDTVWKRAEEVK